MLMVSAGLAIVAPTVLPPSVLPPAAAAPGVPVPPITVYSEDFQNRPGPTPIVRLTGYTGVSGQTYTANPAWLTNCNGWVAQWNQPSTAATGASAQVADCQNNQYQWNAVQQLAQAFGLFAGQTAAQARGNFAVSAFTAGSPGANKVEFQTTTNLPLATSTGRFLTARLDVAAVNCPPTASAPTLQFQLVDDSGTATTIGGVINACTAPDAVTVRTEALGAASATNVRVGTTSSNGSLLWNSPTLGLRIINTNGSGGGNDHAFDNIRIVDATPQLDKEFVPSTIGTTQASTLRFTITNTSELAAKNGWSFTDNLPAGLTVASPGAASSTCGSPEITAPAGGTSIAIRGNLAAGAASCTVSVNVAAAQTGTYTNGPSNIDPLVGLNPPTIPTTLTVVDTDFGDAPASYGTGSTNHTATPGLTLGATRDTEPSALTSATANGDDANGSDDEDAITGAVAVRPGQPMSVSVPVGNTTGSAASLAGWIDFNADGDFADPGERSAVIAVLNGGTSATLTWPAVAGAVPGGTFARLRLYPGSVSDPQPSGAVTGGEVEDHPAILQAPAISVDKTAGAVVDTDGNGVDVGDTITYSFAVTNTGNVSLDPIAVNDPLLGGPVACGTGALAAGASRTCPAVVYALTQADLDAGLRANQVTVSGTPPSGPAVTATDSTSTTLAAAPALRIEKTATLNDADGDGVADVDETISYGFVVTNTGNVTLSEVTVSDPTAGPVTCTPTSLSSSAAATCTANTPYVVTQADVDAGQVVNTASASGVTPTGTTVPSAPDTATVRADVTPGVGIEKVATLNDANGDGLAEVDETISYSFTVTNTGRTTLTDVGVADALAGPVTCQVTTLAPKGTTSCTADTVYTVTEADLFAGSVDNSATASGTPPSGPPVTSDPDTTSTPTAAPAPSLRIDKFADWDDIDADNAVDVGEEIAYSFRVLNDGNVTLNGVGVDDARAGAVTCLATTLAPGASTTCTADAPYVVTQTDVNGGAVVNTATARATNPRGGTDVVSPPDSTSTPGELDPSIEVVKSATVDPAADQGAVRAGDVVTYGFTVFNRGNVTLRAVAINDPTVGAVSCTAVELEPGAQTTCSAALTRTVSQAEFDAGDPVSNTATVSGTAPDGTTVDDEDSVSLPVAAAAPRLEIVKTATPVDTDGDGTLEVGEQIDYSFTVTNTGDVTVENVGVEDAVAGPVTCVPTTLAPRGVASCVADDPYVVTQDDVDAGRVDNTATATGAPTRGPATVTSPPDTATVRLEGIPALELEKIADLADTNGNDVADVDEVITYSFTVTNTGPLTLNGVSVSDPAVGPVTCAPTTIAPTVVSRCTADRTRTVTQAEVDAGDALTNTATASGATRGGAVATGEDTAVVPVATADPAIELVKTASLADTDGDGSADAGEVISYSFVVVNTGNVTVTDPAVTDAALLAPVVCPADALAPGDRVTCTTTAIRIVTQADVNAGAALTNTATATAAGPGGTEPTDQDTANTPLAAPAPRIEVTKTGLLADGDGDGALDVGETITYSVRVENTGNVTLTDLEVADPVIGGVTCPVAELAPGVATTCTGDQVKTVTQADVDAGRVDNTATATATPPAGPPISGEDTIQTPAAAAPVIALDKTATLEDSNNNNGADVGETVAYGFTVTNTGNVTLTGVGVDDPTLGTVTCQAVQLLPTAQTTCTAAARTVTQADVDAQTPLTNTATATGTAPQGDQVTDTDTATTPVAASDPGLGVTKASDLIGDDVLDRGDKVTYTFTATNTGNLTLSDLVTRDPLLLEAGDAITCPTTTLAPGQRTTCVATYDVTAADAAAGRIRNLATARAVTPQGKVITSRTATNTLGNPGSGGGTGGLPDTGGPRLMLIPLGVLAALGGVYLLRRGRRDMTS